MFLYLIKTLSDNIYRFCKDLVNTQQIADIMSEKLEIGFRGQNYFQGKKLPFSKALISIKRAQTKSRMITKNME